MNVIKLTTGSTGFSVGVEVICGLAMLAMSSLGVGVELTEDK